MSKNAYPVPSAGCPTAPQTDFPSIIPSKCLALTHLAAKRGKIPELVETSPMLTAFDIGVGILVLVSALLATTRGLTREVLSLVTWAGSAAFAAYMFFYHPEIARQYIPPEIWADVATAVVSFLGALIILHLLTMRIGDWITDSRLGPLDRTLGFVFGALRGVLIAIVVVIFGTWLLGSNLPDWAA